jgi:biotin operon repressor
MILSTTSRTPTKLSEIKPYQEIVEPRLRLAVVAIAKKTKNLSVCLRFAMWLSPCRESYHRRRQQKIVQWLAGNEWVSLEELHKATGFTKELIAGVIFRLRDYGCVEVKREGRKPSYKLDPEKLPKLGAYHDISGEI